MNEISELVMVPKERVAVLIGPRGSVRKKIEKETETKIEIDSKTGEVEITRDSKAKDQLKTLKSHDIIKAIARGFSPEKAFKLLNSDNYLEIIDLTEYVKDKSLDRIRARIIGKEGKSRYFISKATHTEMVIYGKTVSIIGDAESIEIAKQAVLMLVKGSTHTAVFRHLERKILF